VLRVVMEQPGGGSHFVKHTDTYATTHPDGVKTKGGEDLSRLITCVYYLNDGWQPAHGGELRVFTRGSEFSSAVEWDVPPQLDTLLVFRSHDVEHEVLPTSHERMAVTIWYYGRRNAGEEASTPTVGAASTTTTSEPQPLPVLNSSSSSSTSAASIFVAIPSYRDPECRHTVDDLLRRAMFPDHISIGICLQSTEDDDTLAYLRSKYASDKVRIDFIDYRDAAGPCVARARAQALWRGETYYLQIDSHMRFRHGWDEFLIQELKRCEGSEKPILTTYPLGYSLPNQVRHFRTHTPIDL
jgi:[Skp1-protein]-hydroxyproline N-acetylglucosaminyltransferase